MMEKSTWPVFESMETVGEVPRMPMVATGVWIFISPVGAICPAANTNVPSTSENSMELDFPFGSNTREFRTIRASAESEKIVSSTKLMPSLEPGPVRTTSPWKTGSPIFS
ncbi:hypothetical protein BMS3Bbin10_02373 [bacterium BMS3Bbin10]|nr:hypothetical protein BMS3Bbin10_02373 [bacterium BMS3Bbin10]